MAKPPAPPRPGAKSRSGDGIALGTVSDDTLWAERPEEREVDDFAARLDLATANLEDIALGSIDGSDMSTVGGLPPAEPARTTASSPSTGEPPAPEPKLDPGPSAPAKHAPPPAAGDGLELDFETAGLKKEEAVGQAIPGQEKPGAIVAQAPAAEVEQARAQGLPVPALNTPGAMVPRAPLGPERVTLFGPDPVFAFIVAAGIGLLVGLVPAGRAAAKLYERETQDLFAELENVVERPLAVRAGEVRSPAVVKQEIVDVAVPARNRFFLVWLGVALPITLALGLIRRPAA